MYIKQVIKRIDVSYIEPFYKSTRVFMLLANNVPQKMSHTQNWNNNTIFSLKFKQNMCNDMACLQHRPPYWSAT